jgi:large subunit ribosomal protein L15
MKINELKSSPGARQTAYRKGRGVGSGNGKTAGRGHKGQNARAGGGVRPGFEGGQMPLYRRLPKRGFNNKRFAASYVEINVSDLEAFENGAVVDAAALKASGVISLPKVNDGIKVLGNGELTKKLTVKANAFTTGAKEKIEKAGGAAEEV